MVIRVTSSRGNKLISGKPLAFNELKKAVNEIMRGHIERDFIDTFCSIYGYKVLPYTEGYAAYYVYLETRIVIDQKHGRTDDAKEAYEKALSMCSQGFRSRIQSVLDRHKMTDKLSKNTPECADFLNNLKL